MSVRNVLILLIGLWMTSCASRTASGTRQQDGVTVELLRPGCWSVCVSEDGNSGNAALFDLGEQWWIVNGVYIHEEFEFQSDLIARIEECEARLGER